MSRLGNLQHYFVKVEFDIGDACNTTMKWFGIIEEYADEMGEWDTDEGLVGRERYVAYNLAQMFNHTIIDSSVWLRVDNTEGDTLELSGMGVPFNQMRRPNRTAEVPTDGNMYGFPYFLGGVHTFSPTAPDTRWKEAGGAGAKAPHWPRASWWSTRDIVKYLMYVHGPMDHYQRQGRATLGSDQALRRRIPVVFNGADDTFIPDWDIPTVQTEGRSVLSVLNQLVNPSRLLQMFVDVNDQGDDINPDQTLDELRFHVYSLTPNAIVDPGGTFPNHPAAATARQMTFEPQWTSVTIQEAFSNTKNSVQIRGARQESIFTAKVSSTGNALNDQALGEGWTTTNEDTYNAGNPVGVKLSDAEKNNRIARNQDKLADVFKSFVILPNWNNRDKNAEFVFYDGTPTQAHYPYYNEMRLQTVLPLREEIDYSSGIKPDDDDKLEYRKPYVVMQDPYTTGNPLVEVEKMFNGVDSYHSARTSSWKDGMGIRLNVISADQHFIADTRFVPNAGDYGTEGAMWDYLTSEWTISLKDDRYAEAVKSTDAVNDYTQDWLRQRVYHVGESFRRIRMMDGTLVDVDQSGTAIYSQPGLTDADKWLIDDTDQLVFIAEIASYWDLFSKSQVRINSAKALPPADVFIGDMLLTVNGTVTIATVTQISIGHPLGMNLAVGSMSYSLTAARGEGELIQFLPQPPPPPRPMGGVQ